MANALLEIEILLLLSFIISTGVVWLFAENKVVRNVFIVAMALSGVSFLVLLIIIISQII